MMSTFVQSENYNCLVPFFCFVFFLSIEKTRRMGGTKKKKKEKLSLAISQNLAATHTGVDRERQQFSRIIRSQWITSYSRPYTRSAQT